MATMTVSSKGQIVLPADIRRRLGLMAGTQMEIIEEPDGVRLVVSRPVKATSIAACAGMVTAPAKGKPRKLSEFDAASLLRKPAR
ncbi:MAG: AbrB/MazE/SpoVT family DNA-binding domain-containing protein [Nitrosomonadales bacterium]|nr:AbrB/MazE/SpoVT family DNA-binding domain-containing protein [Nitrosomonadales bacterium]